MLVAAALPSASVHANGVGENYSWQFMTTGDRTNRAFIEDLRLRQRSGMFNSPIYNTVIDRQINCSIAAPAALANNQLSFASVSATAVSSVGTTLVGTAPTPLVEAADGSAISVAGNTTQALARGNAATNTMVFTAGAAFGTSSAGAAINSMALAEGAAVMLNDQDNRGNVVAGASASYQVVLNGGAGSASPAVLNSATSVSGNTVAAVAVGNQATNRMELAALNTGNATAAFNNIQSNSGAITATTTNVTFASSVTGTVIGGAIRNVGNAASATAVGNSSIMTIIGR